MIEKDHPFFYLKGLFCKSESVFYISKYIYTADSLMDDREIIKVNGQDLTEEYINNLISSLEENQELALHSKVDVKKSVFHIPMIDFSCEYEMTDLIFSRMRNFIPKEIMNNIALYNSGRSFHAYSTTLIKSKDFTDFMGRLLLINPKINDEIIDSRWVGHRLMGGYCSLRWSNNTAQYKSDPKRIKYLSNDDLLENNNTSINKCLIDDQHDLL